MSPSAARRIDEEDDLTDDGQPLPEPTGEELERLRARIAEGDKYFAEGAKGIPHDVVMARLRAIRSGG